jgi:hypothetical protein
MSRKYLVIAALVPLLISSFPVVSSAYSPPACTIFGTEKADRINGTSGADVICAGGGNDTINALGGNDIVFGGKGNDKINGGAGDDELNGEIGNDTISGSQGEDDLTGGDGKDSVSGGEGDDMILGGSGADNLSAGNGADLIDGGLGKDTILTGAGRDMCNSDPTDIRLDACIIDSEGPLFALTTTEVKEFSAGELAIITLNVSDAAGIEGVYGSIGGAPGWVTEWCGFSIPATLTSGSNKFGNYTFRCSIPETAVNAFYTLELTAVDLMGHASRKSIAFKVTGGSSDNQSPQVSEIDLPSSARAGQTFVISVTATDESQVSGVYVWFLLEGGGFSDENGIHAKGDDPKLISSNATEYRFDQDYLFGDNAPTGTYKMWISVRDSVGNRNFFDTGRTITLTK